MNVTEALFAPLMADSARPLVSHYDDADGTRIELSRATVANWAAKTANWLRDEVAMEPGARVLVALPAHWQTVGVLLGAWWAGASVVTDPEAGDFEVAFVPQGFEVEAETVAAVALDPLGRGIRNPEPGTVDYIGEIRVHGDFFRSYAVVPGEQPALNEVTVEELIALARSRAAEQGIGDGDRVLSDGDWHSPKSIVDGLVAVIAAGAALVQCTNPDPAKLADRRRTERITVDLTAA
ncbi:TIGR03089 family protein [Allokutzneria albata]|uniref:TIGR03089 family protein n=1 Tax=Allokutzneria albata TaxID=211114 RepID=A0A1H0BD89_ALLAB|nr:TIGR03089 family protein [Allokutzneria albata]SDN43599.1 TIGR03089 family protein [Allokutzneria albata]